MKKHDLMWKTAYLGAALGVYLLDQASKAWAKKSLNFGDQYVVIPNFLNFTYAENPGIAFSLFDNHGEAGRWGLSGLALVAACAVTYYFWRTPKTEDRILGALAMLLAGIVGNLTDRIRLGYVIDFIDVHFNNWHYPTFNVADAAICLGAGLLIFDMFFGRKPEAEKTNEQNETAKS